MRNFVRAPPLHFGHDEVVGFSFYELRKLFCASSHRSPYYRALDYAKIVVSKKAFELSLPGVVVGSWQ